MVVVNRRFTACSTVNVPLAGLELNSTQALRFIPVKRIHTAQGSPLRLVDIHHTAAVCIKVIHSIETKFDTRFQCWNHHWLLGS